jgi:hypothetical protein
MEVWAGTAGLTQRVASTVLRPQNAAVGAESGLAAGSFCCWRRGVVVTQQLREGARWRDRELIARLAWTAGMQRIAVSVAGPDHMRRRGDAAAHAHTVRRNIELFADLAEPVLGRGLGHPAPATWPFFLLLLSGHLHLA